jgi:hypothetical protein
VVAAGLTALEVPVTDQERVEELPAAMLAGDAVKLAMAGGVAAVTVTVAVAVTLPPAFVAVSV